MEEGLNTYALFGKPPGEAYETFIADQVLRDDGSVGHINSRNTAETIKGMAEQQGYTDVRILEMRGYEKPDFVKVATTADKRPAPSESKQRPSENTPAAAPATPSEQVPAAESIEPPEAASLEQITGKSFADFVKKDYSPIERIRKQYRARLKQDGLSLDEKLEVRQALRQADQKMNRLRRHVFDFEDAVTAYVGGKITADELAGRNFGFDKAARQIIAEVSARRTAPENTAAPITPSEQAPTAGSVEPPEPHYLEKIIDRLAESHGWHKEDGKTASKTIEGSGGGMLNPEGRLKVYARFDDNGRYLSLARGSDTLIDIDARDVRTAAAAALINDCAQMLRYSDKPFDRDLIEMRLYGMNLYYSAQQSPEAAAEAREALLPPHHCTPEQFDKIARAVPSDTARRWEIRWPEISEYGYSHAFSDAATAAEAVRDVHRTIINAHLYRVSHGGIRIPDKTEMPPAEVLAHYPNLVKKFLPQHQSLEDKYQAARDAYAKQTILLPDAKKSRRNLLESQMEALIKGLPEQTQMQARANFYISQVSGQMQQKADKPTLGQGEIEFDR